MIGPIPCATRSSSRGDLVPEERERRTWHKYEVHDNYAPSPGQRRVYNERNADRFAKPFREALDREAAEDGTIRNHCGSSLARRLIENAPTPPSATTSTRAMPWSRVTRPPTR